jgi:GMP synthase-like glutamine amidotransferase
MSARSPTNAAAEQWRIARLYEIDLLQEFVSHGKPVLGICRGLQLINVAYGGTLYQDIELHHPKGGDHHDPDAYDQHFHDIAFVAGTGLARLYSGLGRARVNSIHHQGIRDLGKDLVCEAVSVRPDHQAIPWNGRAMSSACNGAGSRPANPDLLDSVLLRGFWNAIGPRSRLAPAARRACGAA